MQRLKSLNLSPITKKVSGKNSSKGLGAQTHSSWEKFQKEGEEFPVPSPLFHIVLYFQVLSWLEEKLPISKNLPKELVATVAPLYSCLEDRSGDVRKKAQAVVPLMMQHVGWDAMSKQANKLKVWFLDG